MFQHIFIIVVYLATFTIAIIIFTPIMTVLTNHNDSINQPRHSKILNRM